MTNDSNDSNPERTRSERHAQGALEQKLLASISNTTGSIILTAEELNAQASSNGYAPRSASGETVTPQVDKFTLLVSNRTILVSLCTLKMPGTRQHWVSVMGTVSDCEPVDAPANDALSISASAQEHFKVTCIFQMNGKKQLTSFSSKVPYERDERFELQVDPVHPERNSLTPLKTQNFLLQAVLMVFWLIASGYLFHSC